MRRGKNPSAGVRGRARIVGGDPAESGVWATCSVALQSYIGTARPTGQYHTLTVTPGAHEVIGRVKELRPCNKEEEEEEEGDGKEEESERRRAKRERRQGNTIDRDNARVAGDGDDLRTHDQGRQTEVHFHSLRQVHSYYKERRRACLRCPLVRSLSRPPACVPAILSDSSPDWVLLLRASDEGDEHLSHFLTIACETWPTLSDIPLRK